MKTTHVLQQSHSRSNKRNQVTYWTVPCNIIKTMPDGRLKVEVFGGRYERDKDKRAMRYVDSHRVSKKV